MIDDLLAGVKKAKPKGLSVREWNEQYPVGTKVRYWPGRKEGPGTESKTRSTAWDLCGSPVVMVEGRAGGIALTHVDVIELQRAPCDDPDCHEGQIVERTCAGTEELRADGLGCGILEQMHAGQDHEFEWDGEEHVYDCPTCNPPKHTTQGMTYAAVGSGAAGCVVLESECTLLLADLNEIGPRPDDVGLDEPPDEGIWKAVVKKWGSKSYEGEYDEGYNLLGEGWVEVDTYPEPYCVMHSERGGPGGCKGMVKARGEDEEATWACEAHAGEVS